MEAIKGCFSKRLIANESGTFPVPWCSEKNDGSLRHAFLWWCGTEVGGRTE